MDTVTLDRSDAPRAARRLAAARCAQVVAGKECVDSVAVLTSEVVTNALVHGTGDITFGVEVDDLVVHVQVGDDDARRPRARRVRDEQAEGGRGMQILQALASAWGVLDRPPGKVVWFTVPAHP